MRRKPPPFEDYSTSPPEDEPDPPHYPLLVRAGILLIAGAACWAVIVWLFSAVF